MLGRLVDALWLGRFFAFGGIKLFRPSPFGLGKLPHDEDGQTAYDCERERRHNENDHVVVG